MKKGMTIIAVLTLIAVASFAAGPEVKMKTSGPSGQGDLIWWAPSTGITNLVMTTNGITVFTVPSGEGIVYTNASLTITRQANASVTNATATATITKQTGEITATAVFTPQTVVITNVIGEETNLYTVVTNGTITVTVVGGGAVMTNATAAVTVVVETEPVAAVTNVVLSNP